MSFSLFKNAFEKLSAENQTKMADSIEDVAEYLLDESKNTLLIGIKIISDKLNVVTEHLADISKSLNVMRGIKTGKVNKKDLEAVSKSAIGMGTGMKVIVTAIESFAKLPDDAAANFVITIEKISEAFKKAESVIKTFATLGPALMKMALGILSFGLALILAAPIYAVAALATLIIMPVMWAWLTFFKVVLKGFPAKKIEQAGEALTVMAGVIFLFGLSLAVSGPIYLLAALSTLIVMPVMWAWLTFFKLILKKYPAKELKETGEALMVMAGAIFLFGLSLAVSGFLYVAALQFLPTIMGIVLGSLLLFQLVLGKDGGKSIQDGAKGLMYMAGVILLFGVALLLAIPLYNYIFKQEGAMKGLGLIAMVILGALAIFYIMSKVSGSIVDGAKGLMYMAGVILLFGVALLLAIPLYNYIFKQEGAMEGLGLIAAVILGAVAVFWLISKIDGSIKKAAVGLMLMALDIVLFGVAIFVFGKLMEQLGDPWKTLELLGAAIGGAGLAMYLIGKKAGIILKGAGALFVATIPLFILTYALKKFKEAGITSDDLLLLGAAVGGLGTAMFLAGKGASEIAQGSGSMILAGGALITIAYGLQKFKDVGLTWADAGLAASVIAGLGIEMGIAGLAAIPIAAGAAAMGLAGGALLAIGFGLAKFKEVSWKKEDGPMLSDSLISLRNGFLGISADDGFLAAIKNVAKMTASIPFLIAAAGAYAIMGAALGSIGSGLKKYKQVNWSDKDSSSFTVSIGALSNTFQTIGKDPKNAAAIRLGVSMMPIIANGITTLFAALKKSEASKFASPLYLIGTGIASLFSVFSSSADVLKNGDKIAQSLSKLLGSVFDTVAKLGAKVTPKSLSAFTTITNDFVLLGKTSTQLEKVAKSMERISSAMGTFKTNMNGIDKGILKDTKGLFEAMAIISKSGSTEDLIKKYSEGLKEVFKQLSDLLAGHSTAVTKAVTASTASNQNTMETFGKQLNVPYAPTKTDSKAKKEDVVAAVEKLDIEPLMLIMSNIENLLRSGIKVKTSQV